MSNRHITHSRHVTIGRRVHCQLAVKKGLGPSLVEPAKYQVGRRGRVPPTGRRRRAAGRSGGPMGRRIRGRSASGTSRSRRQKLRHHRADHTKQARADIHCDRVLLAFEAVGAGDAAADVAALDDLEARHEAKQLDRGRADAMPALLARRVVRDGQLDRPEAGTKLPHSCRSSRNSQTSNVCLPTSSKSSSCTPRISRASRLSMSPQLVDVATMACPSLTVGASAATSRRT